jgi:hypothetical protein
MVTPGLVHVVAAFGRWAVIAQSLAACAISRRARMPACGLQSKTSSQAAYPKNGVGATLFRPWVRLGLCLALLPSVASAQTASQITPPSFRPSLEHLGGFDLTGGSGLGTPSGAEKLFVKLLGVQIKGALPELAAATAELEHRLAGRAVSGAEIFAAARDLEAAYVKAGYVLVRVVLPPQHLVNGAL